MAKQPVTQEAKDTVFENLGLTGEELGYDDAEVGGDEQEGDVEQDGQEQEPVSHTDEQEQEQDNEQDKLAVDDHGNVIADGTKVDARGNIVDKNGKVLARAGSERRIFDQLNRAKYELGTVREQLQDRTTKLNRAIEIGTEALNRLKAVQEQGTVGDKLGLNAQEQLEAFQLFAEGKRDPTTLLKKLLTRAAASGTDLTQLGLQAGTVDPKSLLELVREEIAKVAQPVRDQNEQQRAAAEETRAREQAIEEKTAEVQQFFAERPRMKQYLPIFQKALEQFPRMSLGEIEARIELNLAKMQLQRPQKRSLPNGRRQAPVNRRDGMASADTSWDEIIKDALGEAYQ